PLVEVLLARRRRRRRRPSINGLAIRAEVGCDDAYIVAHELFEVRVSQLEIARDGHKIRVTSLPAAAPAAPVGRAAPCVGSGDESAIVGAPLPLVARAIARGPAVRAAPCRAGTVRSAGRHEHHNPCKHQPAYARVYFMVPHAGTLPGKSVLVTEYNFPVRLIS